MVDEDGVEAGEGVEGFRHVVVWLDLDGVGVPGETERVFDEVAAMGFPVVVGVGGEVGVVVADRTVDFAEDGLGGELFALALQTAVHVGDFFAEGGWRQSAAGGWCRAQL